MADQKKRSPKEKEVPARRARTLSVPEDVVAFYEELARQLTGTKAVVLPWQRLAVKVLRTGGVAFAKKEGVEMPEATE
jgi:hypothetical protein